MQDQQDWINDVKLFDFGEEVVAAFTEEEAIEFYKNTGGFEGEDIEPESELALDRVVIDTEGTDCQCPYCSKQWSDITYRQILKNYKKEELPAYVAGRE